MSHFGFTAWISYILVWLLMVTDKFLIAKVAAAGDLVTFRTLGKGTSTGRPKFIADQLHHEDSVFPSLQPRQVPTPPPPVIPTQVAPSAPLPSSSSSLINSLLPLLAMSQLFGGDLGSMESGVMMRYLLLGSNPSLGGLFGPMSGLGLGGAFNPYAGLFGGFGGLYGPPQPSGAAPLPPATPPAPVFSFRGQPLSNTAVASPLDYLNPILNSP